MALREDFFSQYLLQISGTEVPAIAARWSAIASIGAYLGKSTWFKFGFQNLYPNIYCMLIGTAGSRKSAAIKGLKPLLIQAGYSTIAASKTTKEKFMLDLSGIELGPTGIEDVLEKNLFGESNIASESFIMADEFNDFFGNNNLEFISLLGSLWDWDGPYENRIKNGKSFVISNPCISILGGNTPTGFSIAFPSEILGQGFFSRLLLIYCEPKGIKITWPYEPSEEEQELIVGWFKKFRQVNTGRMGISDKAKALLDKIYKSWRGIGDVRFDSYSNRRFTHLLKLCIIHTVSRLSRVIEETDVIYTNTVLSYAESFMPKALGEFGKAKNSDVVHKIVQVLEATDSPLQVKDLWKHVSNDLEKLNDLSDIMRNLLAADKIQATKLGFLGKKAVIDNSKNDTIDYTLLTAEERRLI